MQENKWVKLIKKKCVVDEEKFEVTGQNRMIVALGGGMNVATNKGSIEDIAGSKFLVFDDSKYVSVNDILCIDFISEFKLQQMLSQQAMLAGNIPNLKPR